MKKRTSRFLYFFCKCRRVSQKPLECWGIRYRCRQCGEEMMPYAIWDRTEYVRWLLAGGNVLVEEGVFLKEDGKAQR